MGLDVVGIDVKGVLLADHRVVQPALRLQDQTEIAMVLGNRRICLNGLRDQLNCPIASAGLMGGDAEVIEADAMESAPVIGVPLKEARLPKGVLVGALVRDGTVIIPRGESTIQKGDRVIIFSPHDAIKKVEKLLSVAFGYF